MQTPQDHTPGGALGTEDRALVEDIDRFLADGLALKRWWDAHGSQGQLARRFDLVRTPNRPDSSYGFFDDAPLDGGRSMAIMGVVDEVFYDQPKATGQLQAPTVEWVQEQLREFVLHYFMRTSNFRQAEKVPAGDAPAAGAQANGPVERKGMKFSQVLARRAGRAEPERFPTGGADAVIDLREIGEVYDWLAVKLRVFDFAVALKPFGPAGPQFSMPLKEESYLVLTPDFVTDTENPEEGVLGEYGFGYAFVKNPERGPFAYGPGEFEAAFQTINFRLHEDGAIYVRMTFVSNRPDRIVNLSIDPINWGLDLADRVSFGMGNSLTAPLRDALGGLPAQLTAPLKRLVDDLPEEGDIDPVLASIALLNLVTNGEAAKRLNISREELNKGFLVQHSMQHYQTILGSLRTWRQIPDWLDADALPAWVRTGVSS